MTTPALIDQTTAREKLIRVFEQTQHDLHTILHGLTDEACSLKPAPDVWSITEILEHLTILERRIPALLESRMAGAAPGNENVDELKDSHLFEGVVARGTKVAAPEHVQPTGRFSSCNEALTAFDSARQDTIAYVRTEPPYLRGRAFPHPIFGPLDGFQWLLVLGAHTKRHTLQIEEIKATFFPAAH